MTRTLDLEDIQGNIVRAYGRYRFPVARHYFLHIDDAASGRAFLDRVRTRITTSERWPRLPGGELQSPDVTLNIAFTFFGLYTLGLPIRTLQRFPQEFIDGMKARAFILGDLTHGKTMAEQPDWDAKWDRIWRENRSDVGEDVHIWLSMSAKVKAGTAEPVTALEDQARWLHELCASLDNAVRILATNGATGDQDHQAASVIFVTGPDGTLMPTAKEHFGFTDGIGNPVFEGQYDADVEADRVKGRGKWMTAEAGWQPIATGEFLLGHTDEAQELSASPPPWEFSRNGTFMAFRKLHENVSSFHAYFGEQARLFGQVSGLGEVEAAATLKAKAAGRWADGVPLMAAPTFSEWQALRSARGMNDPDPAKAALATFRYLKSAEIVDFRYGDDMAGYKCPVTSHLRRANPRDFLDPDNNTAPDATNPKATTRLNKRRRILRRGLPYGPPTLEEGSDETEQGVIFIATCASLFRQFEFVQQQWIGYGLDFDAGNDTCPLIGDHKVHGKFVIPSDPATGVPPFMCRAMPTFVEARGGDYFFVPSMTALRMMAMGIVDPT